jgi:hypothetical protein
MTRSARRKGVWAAAAFASLTLSCNQNYPNPFTAQQASHVPASTDDLIFTSDLYASQANGLSELYSLNSSTQTPTRLTFCNSSAAACVILEATVAPDRQRIAMRQVTQDTNGDGLLTVADGEALVYEDLSRGVQASLAPNTAHVNGLDWSPADGVIVYSALGTGGAEDLYTVNTDGTSNADITLSAGIRERRPRIDPTGSVVAFERIDSSGKGGVYVYDQNAHEDLIDAGGPGSDPLPGTPYVVGADADPVFSPDGLSFVFRRLTAVGNSGLGTWDIMTVHSDGTGLATLATGPLYRGAPDWGPKGIVFVEADPSQQISSIVQIAPDGTGRTVLFSVSGGFTLLNPRWLHP